MLVVKVEETPDYVISHLILRHAKTGQAKEVRHFQFTAWPDFGTPAVDDRPELGGGFSCIIAQKSHLEYGTLQFTLPVAVCWSVGPTAEHVLSVGSVRVKFKFSNKFKTFFHNTDR